MPRAGVGRDPSLGVEQDDQGRGPARIGNVLRVDVAQLQRVDRVTVAAQPGSDDTAHLGRRDSGGQADPGHLSDDQGQAVVGQHHDVEPRSTRLDRVVRHAEPAVDLERGEHGQAGRLDHVVERGHALQTVTLRLADHLTS